MSKFWCAVLVAALSSTALARGGDDGPNGQKIDETRMKSLGELSAELEAQKAQLEAQRLQIQALQAQASAMSLDGNGALLDPQAAAQAKPALPEQIKSKWAMNIYGFIEADFIADNHQLAPTVSAAGAITALNGAVDAAGNPTWPLGRQYATEHGMLTFGARNSRIGLNVAAPEYAGIRASGKLEMDFLGTNGGGTTESNATWTNPTFRIRHMYLTLDNDYVTVTLGQGWELFGWQPYFHPNTVDIQGVPGQIYSRSPKAQFSHKFNGPVDIELGAALSRPPERGADSPDIQAGIKISVPDWVGVHTIGAAGTAIDAAAIGISGTSRAFRVPNTAVPANITSDATRGEGAALDIFLPILHPDKESKGNSLSVTGEIVYGKGISDLYTGFTGGAPAVVGVADNGSVGVENADLTAIQWRTDILGVQYYLPGEGNWWISLNYSSGKSNNMHSMAGVGAGAGAFHAFRFLNADLFWDVTPAVRLGLSVDQYRDSYIEQTPSHFGTDTRIQFSAFYLF